MRIDFYHLTAAPLERVLPSICERVIAKGERLLIVAAPDQLERLDRDLWTYAPDSFLPHGREGEGQPVLLSAEAEPINGATNVALADGRWRDDALGFERAFYFFDGATIDEARQSWRALKDKPEIEPHYWRQESGGKWVEGP